MTTAKNSSRFLTAAAAIFVLGATATSTYAASVSQNVLFERALSAKTLPGTAVESNPCAAGPSKGPLGY
ncbi:hypothetical protein [Telmatospirillum sp.]|uniref:hypothetical protein n=1 Tax=Telmatospirillum sp. TaxID=2079197 RepID=UPI00284AB112|nr:hypothetical protein [Telmatospirillum sp.]MDR3436988.1 hypothetical protein [Telmatospirillum sp.]